MRSSSMMLTAIEGGDWSDATIAAALDALKEDFGHTAAKCVTIVAHFIKDAQDAAVLRIAKNISERDGRVTPLVRGLVNGFLGLPADCTARVNMSTGEHPPRLALPRVVGGRKIEDANTIEVGAGWLLDMLELERPSVDKPNG